jgi:hypothetical protein
MPTEPRVQAKSQRHPTEKHARAWEVAGNVIGIVMGLPIFLAGTWSAHDALRGDSQMGLLAVILLPISISLLIPTRLYERGTARAFGFVALSLAAAVTVSLAFFLGWWTYELLSNPPNEYNMFGLYLLAALMMVGILISSVFALSCTCVLVFKVKPNAAHAAVGITAGIAVGLLTAVLMYLLHFRHW